ncbi:MAG: Npt1/Npt2 family nucleotide transporter [Acidobacteriota bacterium]
MHRRAIHYVLKPFGQIRRSEAQTTFLLFLYSFLVMAAYNVIKPATRSKFIEELGPDNLPYVQLAAGLLIGFIMAVYSRFMLRLPRRWCLSIAQGGIAAILLAFWYLFHRWQTWEVSVAFYLLGLIMGILLISQFWTLANLVFDPRQAKRLFGLIGGGASLGGILGSFLAKNFAEQLHTENLLLFSAGFMLLSVVAVGMIVRREGMGEEMQEAVAGMEKGVAGKQAIQLLRKSKHLRLIALVISFATIGAVIIEQQLNMAAFAVKGQGATDAITAFLANVQLWTSVIGFMIQIFLTSRIHQQLGIGFALLMLPVSLGSSAVVMLLNAALWAPGLARVLDQSLRYTVDKTTREVLYMPLPSDMKLAAKPFVDVTVDRFARGLAAVLLLFLIKPWGLSLSWQRLSFASIVITGVWIFIALRAGRGYREELRKCINTRELKPAEAPATISDQSTVETLIQELASPDEQRVLYAIEFLDSLDKRHLITPLLLYHESPAVRVRALSVIRVVQPEISARWLPAIQALMTDPDPNVRSEALGALAGIRNLQTRELLRSLMDDRNPRISLTAAMMLAGSGNDEDAARAEEVLGGLLADTRDSSASVRRDFAIAIRHVPMPHFRRFLVPLLDDPDPEVAEEAMRSARTLGAADFIFIPTLICLLRNRRQKGSARELLVSFGEQGLPVLKNFLRDPEEDIWIRRHIPATIARIPCQKSMDILIDALDEKDGFLRYHVIAALERIHRIKPELSFDRSRIEQQVHEEIARYSKYRRLYRILFELQAYPRESLLARATAGKMKRSVDRIYRLLSLLYPWKDIAAARHTIEHGDMRSRAGSLEYLDNVLTGGIRKTLIPLLEDALREAQMPNGRSGPNAEAAVRKLVNDEDPVVASSAIYFILQQRFSNLADELERILETREDRDRQVLETVSWVLQEFRNPDPTKGMIRPGPLPSVDLVNRMCNLSLFGSVSVDEIFRICNTGRQVQFEPEELLCRESVIPESVYFLLNGCVDVTKPGSEPRRIEAPAVLAFQEVLEEQPMADSVRTVKQSLCLTLTCEEIHSLLADNSDLVPGIFQMLCDDSQSRRIVVKGHASSNHTVSANGNLNLIEKGLVLKTIPVFSHVSPDEIFALASISTEVRLQAGTDLLNETDHSAIYALVSGKLSIERDLESPVVAGPSDVIGIYETLAGIDFGFHAIVLQEVRALRIDREDLFDLLVQRSTLLRQVFKSLFRTQPGTAAVN